MIIFIRRHINTSFNAIEGIYYARYMDSFVFLQRYGGDCRRERVLYHFIEENSSPHTPPRKMYIEKISHRMEWNEVRFNEHRATSVAECVLGHHCGDYYYG